MNNVVAFTRADEPDPEFIQSGDYGTKMYRYAVAYVHNGKFQAASIWAYSMDDAEDRVSSMRDSLILEGQIVRGGSL